MRKGVRRLASVSTLFTVCAALLAVAILLTSPGSAPRRPSQPAPVKLARARSNGSASGHREPLVRALFVGASLTSGLEQSSLSDTYPGKVVARLRERGLEVQWEERAQSGATVGDALTWPYPADQQIIVVHLITNDFLRGTPVGVFQGRLHRVLAELRERSPEAHLVCLGTWEAPDKVNRDQVSLATYDATAKEACRGERGTFVPLDRIFATPGTRGPLGESTPWGPTDGWHPNNVGAQDIADAVLATIPEGTTP